jgi:AAA ATPase domain
MPINPYAGSQLMPAPLDFFVGRTTELEALRSFMVDVAAGAIKERVVHVSGSAGTGKSFLLAKLRAEVASAELIGLAVLDVDTDAFDSGIPAPELLWRLRFALRRAGVRTPLYDLFYAAYFTKYVLPGVTITLPGLLESLGKVSEPVEKAGSAASSTAVSGRLAEAFDADFMKDLAEGAGELAKSTKAIQLFVKLSLPIVFSYLVSRCTSTRSAVFPCAA